MKKGIFILGLFLVFCFVIFSTSSEEVTEEVEDRGIFVSYIELANYLKGKGKMRVKKQSQRWFLMFMTWDLI